MVESAQNATLKKHEEALEGFSNKLERMEVNMEDFQEQTQEKLDEITICINQMKKSNEDLDRKFDGLMEYFLEPKESKARDLESPTGSLNHTKQKGPHLGRPQESTPTNVVVHHVNSSDQEGNISKMDEIKSYICLQAKDNKGKHVYLVCSLKFNDLTSPPSHSPALTKEAYFEGYPYMGCGFFQSKIVFAGGEVEEEEEVEEISKHNGFITFDMKSKEVSSNSFPSMLHGKIKPLVFQLSNKLYVMDTILGYRQGSYEYFDPKKEEWHNLLQPAYEHFYDVLEHPYGLNYPCVVIGNTCYLSLPILSVTYHHHPEITYKEWLRSFPCPLPFSGVASFYQQDGFDDFVLISFRVGVVKVHRFHLYYRFIGVPKVLFTLPFPSDSDAEMSGYFADFGDGIFSLTASDGVCVYVSTFKILRLGVQSDMPMKLEFEMLTQYEYKFDALSFGVDILSVVGCFAPSPNDLAINCADEVFNKHYTESCDDRATFEVFGIRHEPPEGQE